MLPHHPTVYVGILKFLGNTVFIGLLKMVIVPLIFSSIVAGIAGRKKSGGFGRLGTKDVGILYADEFCSYCDWSFGS